mmetsp:Transcript_104633/g.249093  ORF Transcript_104633/g.249093 Transcript_104633/m.249093 type:complete len:244 (+) Transcript_104633:838-1569(+)
MQAEPTMQSTRLPGTIAFTPAESKPCMLSATMLAPASPKPKASKDPSLMIVFSKIAVSIIASSCAPPLKEKRLIQPDSQPRPYFSSHTCCCTLPLLSRNFLISSPLNSSSAIFMAAKGLSLIKLTFSIMRSTGRSTSAFASLENCIDATHRTRQMNPVSIMLLEDSNLTNGLASKKKAKCQSSNCSCVIRDGRMVKRSCGRRSSGHLTGYDTTSWRVVESSDVPTCFQPPYWHSTSQSPLSKL